MRFYTLILLLLFSAQLLCEEPLIYAKLIQNKPLKAKISKEGQPDVIIKIKTEPPTGMSDEEYKKLLIQRSLKNVVKGISEIQDKKIIENVGSSRDICHSSYNHPLLSTPEHTKYLGAEAVGIFTVFLLNIPLNTKTEPSQSLQWLSNSGNTMVSPMTLFDSAGNSHNYEFDAVNEVNSLHYTKPISKKDELTIKLKIYSATGSGLANPAQWLVGDRFIESVHGMMGINDPFDREEKGYDKVILNATDTDGDQLDIESNKLYVMPLEVGLNHYEQLYASETLNVSANGNITVSLPLAKNQINNNLSLGTSIGLNATKSLTPSISLTGAAKTGVVKNDLYQLDENSYDFTDQSYKYDTHVLGGINVKGDKTTSSFYASYHRTSAAHKDLDIPGGVDAAKGMVDRYAYYAPTKPQEYFEIGTTVSYKKSDQKTITVEFSIREDFQSKRYSEHDSPLTGNNNEDFGVFFGIGYDF